MAGSELPIVLINVMRGGPGLGSIGPSQSDYFQATKGHGHGDYRVPVLAPVLDRRGGRARRRRLRDRRALPDAGHAPRRRRAWARRWSRSCRSSGCRPRTATTGQLTGADGRAPRVVRSLHLRPEDLEAHNRHLQAKFADDRRARGPLGGRARSRTPRSSIVAYGTAARVARTAIERARDARPARRPVPADHASGRSRRRRSPSLAPTGSRAILVVEMSAGQMVEDVRLAVEGRTPGLLPRPDRRHGPDAGRGRRRPAPSLGADRADGDGPADRRDRPPTRAGPAEPDRARRLGSRARIGEPTRPIGDGDPMRPLTSDPARVDLPAARRCWPTRRPTTARAAATASSTASSPSCSTRCDLGPTTIGVASVGCSVFAYDYLDGRLRRVAPRPGARGRDRRPARPARRVRVHLPGRRRPRRDRDGRDRPRRGPRRADQRRSS